jgi:hypothetical protein
VDFVPTLALKLVLTPVLVGASSLAGRRWGSEIGGWLVGIPFTSGPIALFLALDPGLRFAAGAAAGILAGTATQAAFCLAYAWVAQRRGWAASLAASTAAYLFAVAVLDLAVLPLLPGVTTSFAVMLAGLLLSLRLMPRRQGAPTEDQQFPRWDLPARMIVATAFVVALTAAAPWLGPRLAGLLAPYPLYATVLAVFAHRLLGAAPAVGVLRGLLLGLFAFASFFFVVSSLLVQHGIAVAFGAAILVMLLIQGASLTLGRRFRLA